MLKVSKDIISVNFLLFKFHLTQESLVSTVTQSQVPKTVLNATFLNSQVTIIMQKVISILSAENSTRCTLVDAIYVFCNRFHSSIESKREYTRQRENCNENKAALQISETKSQFSLK